MTEDYFILDFSSDDFLEQNEPPEPTEFWEFGKWQFVPKMQSVTFFAKGETFVADDVMVNGEPFTRKGMKNGGKGKIGFILQTKKNLQGEEYTIPHVYTTQLDIPLTPDKKEFFDRYFDMNLSPREQEYLESKGTVRISKWNNLQAPAIRASVKKQPWAAKTMGEGIYAKALKLNTGKAPYESKTNFDEEGNPKVYYDNFFAEFVFYKTEEEMLQAQEEYFGGKSESSASSIYPDSWGEHLDSMVEFVKSLAAEGKSHKEIAEQAQILDHPNVKKILSQILDVPEPMIKL